MTTLFKPAEITTAKLKMGIMGFQGAGKTHTATETAIGLVLLLRKMGLSEGNKPIAFLDTEKGSDWILPRVNAAGIEMQVAKTRSFNDLCGAITEAEASASVLLIDSLTHFWKEFVQSYKRVKKRTRIEFQDWDYLKGEEGWQKFTDRFINTNLHIIFAGRAGYEYENEVDEETGKRQIYKSGIKMKVEGETGYEPDLLVLMERQMNMVTKADEHVAHVIKDRSTLLDGKEFPDPTFETFLPHIQRLNLGGKHMGVDISRTSDHSIHNDPYDNKSRQRHIVVELIEDLLTKHGFGGTAAANKQKRIEIVSKHFGTSSKTEIEDAMPLLDLRANYDTLHQELEGKPSRYSASVITAATAKTITIAEDLKDGIPDFLQREPAKETPVAVAVPINDTSDNGPVEIKPVTVKDRLLSDIPNLKSVHECLGWGLSMSDTFETLNKTDKKLVHEALMAQQVKCLNGTGHVTI